MTVEHLLVVAAVAALVGAAPGAAAGSPAEPTLSATGSLRLTPVSGAPGTTVTAVASNLKCSVDIVDFTWVDHDDVAWSTPESVDGDLAATTTVPASFGPGTYAARATCAYVGGGEAYVEEEFVVTAIDPPPPPALTVLPETAPAGSPVTATVSGLDCPPDAVSVVWSEGRETWEVEVGETPELLTASSTIPVWFEPGPHEVVAGCTAYDTSVSGTVVVVEAPVPRLSVDPLTGPAGSVVDVTASGHSCAGAVELLWHGELVAGTAQVGTGGTATTRVAVPADFAPGRHDLLGRCVTDGYTWPLAWFTIPASSDTATPDHGQQPPIDRARPTSAEPGAETTWPAVLWGAIAASVLAALLAAALLVHAQRWHRWVRLHVRAVPGAGVGPGAVAVESRATGSPLDVSVAIRPRPDAGSHTIEETRP